MNGCAAPTLPVGVERQPADREEARVIDRSAVERLLTRRDVPLREKTLWRMLYETPAHASEILALNIDDMELEACRARVMSKAGAVEYVYWASGIAQLPPRLIRGRERGAVFLSERRPCPARCPAARDLCPHTVRARLGCDHARVLLAQRARTATAPGWDLHQLRHSAATPLGEANANLQLIIATGQWRTLCTAMRCARPGAVAVAEVAALLDIAPSREA